MSSHKDLVAQVSTVHNILRRKYKESLEATDKDATSSGAKDRASIWENIWKGHTENRELLETYSKAMHLLATTIWEPKHIGLSNCTENSDSSTSCGNAVKCRIEWVSMKCRIYFGPQQDKLKLLDVGSCYNPFSKYSQLFDITALDLQPAAGFEQSIYRNDFLKLAITDIGSQKEIRNGQNGIIELISLAKEQYDVVVFSFVLEYLPSPTQRYECCQKAKNLLKPNGLLFILRPDSNRVTANSSKWMKQWKIGLGSIGFKRVFFDKLEHLWCTGYAKLENEHKMKEFVNSVRFHKDLKKYPEDLNMDELFKFFSLPQDSCRNEANTPVRISCAEGDIHLFNELPFDHSI